MTRRVLFLALLFAHSAAPAMEEPTASARDPHMRSVAYAPDDVVVIRTVIGYATHIILEPGEVYRTHAFGDSAAWDFMAEGHHLFLKPRAEHADQNLIVVTDRRSYVFRLLFSPKRRALAYYQVRFRYPDAEAAARRAQQAKAATTQALATPAPRPWNLAYTRAGDAALAPVHAWDDGLRTVLVFGPGRELPAVFAVGADGAETLARPTVLDPARGVVSLPAVGAEWRLRLGRRTMRIFNEAADLPRPAADSRTLTPAVRRITQESP